MLEMERNFCLVIVKSSHIYKIKTSISIGKFIIIWVILHLGYKVKINMWNPEGFFNHKTNKKRLSIMALSILRIIQVSRMVN
jgi:hypothetical protein